MRWSNTGVSVRCLLVLVVGVPLQGPHLHRASQTPEAGGNPGLSSVAVPMVLSPSGDALSFHLWHKSCTLPCSPVPCMGFVWNLQGLRSEAGQVFSLRVCLVFLVFFFSLSNNGNQYADQVTMTFFCLLLYGTPSFSFMQIVTTNSYSVLNEIFMANIML